MERFLPATFCRLRDLLEQNLIDIQRSGNALEVLVKDSCPHCVLVKLMGYETPRQIIAAVEQVRALFAVEEIIFRFQPQGAHQKTIGMTEELLDMRWRGCGTIPLLPHVEWKFDYQPTAD